MPKTIDAQIRDRLYIELKKRRGIVDKQRVIDQVLAETTVRIDFLVNAIVHEVGKQQVAMSRLDKLQEVKDEYEHYASETATLGVNLADVFFRSDVNLFAKHLRLAEDEVIVSALTHDTGLLDRVREIIARIDPLCEGVVNNDG